MDLLANLVVTWFFALLFVISGMRKIFAATAFRGVLHAYGLLPAAVVGATSRVLPLIEVAIGLAMLVESSRSWAASMAATLIGLYALAMGFNILRGRTYIKCGCSFQSEGALLSWWHLLRNVVLLSICLSVLLPVTRRLLLWPDYLQIGFAVIGFGLLYTTLELIQAIRR